MKTYLPFVVIGLTTGAVYALASMGLVLTYTTSGVFNFAHGAVGMFSTYIFYSLRVDAGVPTPIAVVVAVLVVAPMFGIVIDRVLLRRLYGAAESTYVVASLGLLVALQGLAVAIYGPETRQVEPLFPSRTYRLPGLNVGYDQTLVVGIAVTAGIGLAYFFRKTHLGLQTRAVVGDRDLTEMVGTNARLVTTFSWMLGCAFAALSGVLFAPFIQLDSLLLTLLVVQAFGAAVVGGLRSLSVTNLGAYGIAVAGGLITKIVATKPSLAALPSALPFLVLFAALLVAPKGYFAGVTKEASGGRFQHSPSGRVPYASLLLLAGLAALLPLGVNDARLLTVTTTIIFVLIFSSLSLLVGLSRQISLAHAVFAVFGATTLSHLLSAGIPYPAALFLSALVMVPLGALLALPAIRLSGLFLALATFGFGVLFQYLVLPTGIAFGKRSVVLLPRPESLHSDTAFHYFTLAVVVLGVLAMELIRVSRLGRFVRALGDSPTAVQSLGVNPTAARVLVFCLSAFFAAVAGGLLGTLVQTVNPTTFDFFQSLIWLTVLVAAGTQTLSGSVLAAVALVAVPALFTSPVVQEWQPVAFGVSAIAFAQARNGLVGLLSEPWRAARRIDFTALAQRSSPRLDRRRVAERYVTATGGWADA